jgi:hypothetical protein
MHTEKREGAPAYAAAAALLPGRCNLASPKDRSAPPLANTRALASTIGAVSAPSTRLPVLVQGSDATHATRLLARSAGSQLPASALTTPGAPDEASLPALASLPPRNATSRRLVAGETAGLAPHRVPSLDSCSRSSAVQSRTLRSGFIDKLVSPDWTTPRRMVFLARRGAVQ